MIGLFRRRRLSVSGKGVLAIAGGAAGGQFVTLLVAPILSRQYSPADFGVFTVIIAVAAVIGSVAAGRFEQAIPVPKDDNTAHSLLILGLISCFVVTSLTLLLTVLFGDALARAFDDESLHAWAWFAPLIGGLTALYGLYSQVCVRKQQFAPIGRRNFVRAAATAGAQTSLGAVGATGGGLLFGYGAGNLIATLGLLRTARVSIPELRVAAARRRLAVAAARFKRFPLILTPASFLNMLGLPVPAVLLGGLYGTDVAGWLGMTQRVLSVPVLLLGAAVGQVFLSDLAVAVREDRRDTAIRLFDRATRRLAVAAIAIAAVCAIAGPVMFRVALGEEWTESGHFAQALALMLATQLIASPLSRTLTVFERHWTQLAWDLGRLTLIVGTIVTAWWMNLDILTAVWLYSGAAALCYTASWQISRVAVAGWSRFK